MFRFGTSISGHYEIVLHGHQTGSRGTMQPVQVAHQRVWQVCQLELCTWHHQSPLQRHEMICEYAAFVLALHSYAGNDQLILEACSPWKCGLGTCAYMPASGR